MGKAYHIVSPIFRSNCLLSALKAKAHDPKNVRLIFIPKDKCQPFHVMWTDGRNDYDFSDLSDIRSTGLCDHLWYDGVIRRFRKGFAAEYKSYRTQKGGNECLETKTPPK